MKKYQLLVHPALALLMVSCSGNKIDEAIPVAPAVRPAPPAPQPQDGSFIVRPDGTRKVKLSRNVQFQASAAAESLRAGADMALGGGCNNGTCSSMGAIPTAMQRGLVNESAVDEALARILYVRSI